MNIEFENINPNLEIIEYVIRDIELEDYEEKKGKYPHFQARIKAKEEFDCDGNINCILSYYDVNGVFLGLDKGDIWTHDTDVKDPVPLSMPIDIPENAARAVFRFNHVDTKASGFYAWAGKIATFMALMLLFSWMMTSFGF